MSRKIKILDFEEVTEINGIARAEFYYLNDPTKTFEVAFDRHDFEQVMFDHYQLDYVEPLEYKMQTVTDYFEYECDIATLPTREIPTDPRIIAAYATIERAKKRSANHADVSKRMGDLQESNRWDKMVQVLSHVREDFAPEKQAKLDALQQAIERGKEL